MQDLKEQARTVILSHLRSKSHPEMTLSQLLSELKPKWTKLKKAKLTQLGGFLAAGADPIIKEIFGTP